MRGLVLLVVLAGCNRIFDLRETVLGDAGATIDAPPAIVFVQMQPDEQPVASLGVAFANPVTGGDTIVACVFVETTAPPMVTDSLGNAYAKVDGPYPFVPYANMNANMYVFVATAARGGSDTVTVSTPDATDTLLMIHEFANITSLDTATGATGTSTITDAMTSGDLVTTAHNEMIFGFGIARTVSAGTGFTLLSSFAANVTEDRLVDTPGTYRAFATDLDPPGNEGWTMLGAAFIGR